MINYPKMSKPDVHGEIFAVPFIDGTFLHGRILLDIKTSLKKRYFPADSSLTGVGDAYLVEMYSKPQPSPAYVPSDVLIPGAFIDSKHASKVWQTWPISGNESIDPTKVEFPETLIGFQHPVGEIAFQCGEIFIPLPIKRSVLSKINQFGGRHSAFLWPFVCLWEMGRHADVPTEYRIARVDGTDLRVSPHRRDIYKYLPFDMEMSYYEKQSQLGLHFERLY